MKCPGTDILQKMRIFISRLKWFVPGFVFAVLAIVVWQWYAAADISRKIDALPDYDYIAEIEQLIAEKKYGEAKILAEDVMNLHLPCSKRAGELLIYADNQSKKVWTRICKVSRGFTRGKPDSSIEEVGGSIASDMVMYGDIRDLVYQGYYKLTGRETDNVVIALSSIGLATEFVDFADWAPAALKAIKKTGAMTKSLGDYIIAMCRKIIKTRKIDAPAKAFFSNTKSLLDSAGFIRTRNIFRNVKHADELAVIQKSARNNPSLTHVVAKHSGAQTADVLKNSSPEFMKKIARKGRMAVRFMKTFHKHKKFVRMIPAKYVYSCCGILFLLSIICFWQGCRNRKKEKKEIAELQ